MERSGHQSVGGVRSYERSTTLQSKEMLSVMVSSKTLEQSTTLQSKEMSSIMMSRKALEVLKDENIEPKNGEKKVVEADGKENEVDCTKPALPIVLNDLKGCTINHHYFTFNY